MRSLWLLFVVVSAAYAAQVASPVYRAPPTITMARNSNMNNPVNANPIAEPVQAEAEEREGQNFPNADNAKAVNSVVNPSVSALTSATHSILPTNTVVQPATLMQPASLVQTQQPATSYSTLAAADPQQYQVYMMNPAVAKPLTTPVQVQPYTTYQQAYDGQYNPLQYQGQQVTAPSDGLLNNLPWRDILVGLSSLALLGLGASLAYPALKQLRARALRELQDIKADDAARMAKSVMKAIQKFSEINKHE